MAKIEFEKESQGQLVRMCEGKGLNHIGDKDALVARLVEWEASQEKPEAEAEPEAEAGPEAEAEPEPEPEAEPED